MGLNSLTSRPAIRSNEQRSAESQSFNQGESMKRAAMTFGMLAVAVFVAAQQPAPAQKNQPAGATQTAAAPAPPQGKRPPQAKTQPEYDAFNAAMANQK